MRAAERKPCDLAALLRHGRSRLDAASNQEVGGAPKLSESDLRNLLDISPFAAVVFDEKGLLVYANPRYFDLFGHSGHGPATLDEWWRLAYPQVDYRERVQADWMARLSEAAQNDTSMRPMNAVITRQDGTVCHVELFAARMGERLCIVAVDINERERVEAARRAGEERYRRFVQMSGEGVWRFDLLPPMTPDLPEDVLVEQLFERAYVGECNDEFARQLGYNRAPDVLGRRLAELMRGEREQQLAAFRSFVRGGFRVADLLTSSSPSAEQAIWTVSSLVGIIEQDWLVCVWGTRRDVTSQRLAQQALQRSEVEFRAIFDRAPVGIVLVSPEGRILHANEAFRDILGHAEDDVGPLRFDDFVHPDDRERMRGVHVGLTEGGEGARDWIQIETRFLRKDETIAWVSLVASPVRDARPDQDEGRSPYVVG